MRCRLARVRSGIAAATSATRHRAAELDAGGARAELCLAGTPGAELVIAPERDELVFVKHEHDAFASGALAGRFENRAQRTARWLTSAPPADLQRRGVARVYVCGVTTNHCVRATAVGAVAAGFETVGC